jgi:hypothetical protein
MTSCTSRFSQDLGGKMEDKAICPTFRTLVLNGMPRGTSQPGRCANETGSCFVEKTFKVVYHDRLFVLIRSVKMESTHLNGC